MNDLDGTSYLIQVPEFTFKKCSEFEHNLFENQCDVWIDNIKKRFDYKLKNSYFKLLLIPIHFHILKEVFIYIYNASKKLFDGNHYTRKCLK